MKIIVEGAAYGARYEREWKGDDALRVDCDFSVMFEYLWQYKGELQRRYESEPNEMKKQIMMAKICDIEEFLEEYKDLALFFQESATAL